MSKLIWRGGALTAPVPPCMVTCGSGEKANVLTVAWTGIINTVPPKTYISVRPSRHSYRKTIVQTLICFVLSEISVQQQYFPSCK